MWAVTMEVAGMDGSGEWKAIARLQTLQTPRGALSGVLASITIMLCESSLVRLNIFASAFVQAGGIFVGRLILFVPFFAVEKKVYT